MLEVGNCNGSMKRTGLFEKRSERRDGSLTTYKVTLTI
jgi:hypothetical protein